jgi:hypothetical protein
MVFCSERRQQSRQASIHQFRALIVQYYRAANAPLFKNAGCRQDQTGFPCA